ncbi:hypothetical protein IWX49DRAFT_556928 [Phyllosticta citricarpa]
MWMAFFGAGDCNGFVQEYLVRDEPMKLPAPTNVSLVEAAAYATAWLTSYDSLSKGSMGREKLLRDTIQFWLFFFLLHVYLQLLLVDHGGVMPTACLIMMLMSASAAGATATATSSFDQKLEFVKKIGAKHSINYGKAPNWTEETL